MQMPFGKHKGKELSELPIEYIEWLLSKDLRDPLLSAIEEELDRRASDAYRRPRHSPVDKEAVKRLITAGYRQLALRAHPDHGGDTQSMQTLNAAKEWMLQRIKELV